MRAGGQRRDVRLARVVMLSARAQGNRRQQGQGPQPTAAVRLTAGRPAPGVGYISKRERERERESRSGGELGITDDSMHRIFLFCKNIPLFRQATCSAGIGA